MHDCAIKISRRQKLIKTLDVKEMLAISSVNDAHVLHWTADIQTVSEPLVHKDWACTLCKWRTIVAYQAVDVRTLSEPLECKDCACALCKLCTNASHKSADIKQKFERQVRQDFKYLLKGLHKYIISQAGTYLKALLAPCLHNSAVQMMHEWIM